MDKRYERYKPYQYAEDILKLIGFKSIVDYDTLVPYEEITNDTISAVNAEMTRFKPLFKLREFNLSRYKYRLNNCTQLMNFIRKVLSQLDILHEVLRHNDKNVMRLKSPNIILESYIMSQDQSQKLATGSLEMSLKKILAEPIISKPMTGFYPKPSVPIKEKLMSVIMSEYASRTAIYEDTVYFYGSVELKLLSELNTTHVLDVITKLECSSPFTLTIGGKEGQLHTSVDLLLPISLLRYHYVTLTVHVTTLSKLVITSQGLNKLRFNPEEFKIILDDPVMTGSVVMNGLCIIPRDSGTFKHEPVEDCTIQCNDMLIFGETYKISSGCSCRPAGKECVGIMAIVSHSLEGYLEPVQSVHLEMIHSRPNDDGTYNIMYPMNRIADVIHRITLPPGMIGSIIMGPLERSLDGSVLNFPSIATGCGLPVTGSGLCPSIYHNAKAYIILKNMPVDKLYHYKRLTVKIENIFLNTGSRNQLAIKPIQHWFAGDGTHEEP